MLRATILGTLLLVLTGCHLLPGDDFSDEANFINQTDQPLVIYWLDEIGQEALMIELQPGPPGGTVYLPECDPRGLVVRTVTGEEFARRDGPTCGGWVITSADGPDPSR